MRFTALKEARMRKGLSQWELAMKANIPETTLSRFENHRREPTPEQWERLAAVLEVPVEQIQAGRPQGLPTGRTTQDPSSARA